MTQKHIVTKRLHQGGKGEGLRQAKSTTGLERNRVCICPPQELAWCTLSWFQSLSCCHYYYFFLVSVPAGSGGRSLERRTLWFIAIRRCWQRQSFVGLFNLAHYPTPKSSIFSKSVFQCSPVFVLYLASKYCIDYVVLFRVIGIPCHFVAKDFSILLAVCQWFLYILFYPGSLLPASFIVPCRYCLFCYISLVFHSSLSTFVGSHSYQSAPQPDTVIVSGDSCGLMRYMFHQVTHSIF